MDFEWIIERDKKLSFEDRVHNLACFEIVVNILRMKTKAGEEDIAEEMQALCGFALDCMFKDKDLKDDNLFGKIMKLKNEKVNIFRADILKQIGVPDEVSRVNEIGEA